MTARKKHQSLEQKEEQRSGHIPEREHQRPYKPPIIHWLGGLEVEINGMLTDADLSTLVDNAPKCGPDRSVLHGYGLFARKPIEENEVIVDFSSCELYREVPVAALEEWRLRGGKFTALSTAICLISDSRTKYSLLNHSRTPNAMVDGPRRVVFALRRINPGEEVTVDYRIEPMPERVKPFYELWL